MSKKSVYLQFIFFFQAEDGIRDRNVTGVQTCALPILRVGPTWPRAFRRRCGATDRRCLPRDKARRCGSASPGNPARARIERVRTRKRMRRYARIDEPCLLLGLCGILPVIKLVGGLSPERYPEIHVGSSRISNLARRGHYARSLLGVPG